MNGPQCSESRYMNGVGFEFSVGLKTLLHQGLSEPEFYGDLVYKFKKNCR